MCETVSQKRQCLCILGPLYSWTFVFLNLCILEPLYSWTFVFLDLCILGPLYSWTFVFLNLCILEPLYSSTFVFLDLCILGSLYSWTAPVVPEPLQFSLTVGCRLREHFANISVTFRERFTLPTDGFIRCCCCLCCCFVQSLQPLYSPHEAGYSNVTATNSINSNNSLNSNTGTLRASVGCFSRGELLSRCVCAFIGSVSHHLANVSHHSGNVSHV
jgi:hypothetical protein